MSDTPQIDRVIEAIAQRGVPFSTDVLDALDAHLGCEGLWTVIMSSHPYMMRMMDDSVEKSLGLMGMAGVDIDTIHCLYRHLPKGHWVFIEKTDKGWSIRFGPGPPPDIPLYDTILEAVVLVRHFGKPA